MRQSVFCLPRRFIVFSASPQGATRKGEGGQQGRRLTFAAILPPLHHPPARPAGSLGVFRSCSGLAGAEGGRAPASVTAAGSPSVCRGDVRTSGPCPGVGSAAGHFGNLRTGPSALELSPWRIRRGGARFLGHLGPRARAERSASSDAEGGFGSQSLGAGRADALLLSSPLLPGCASEKQVTVSPGLLFSSSLK